MAELLPWDRCWSFDDFGASEDEQSDFGDDQLYSVPTFYRWSERIFLRDFELI